MGTPTFIFLAKKIDIFPNNQYNKVGDSQRKVAKNMSKENIIRKLIGIQDVNVKEIKENEKSIDIYIDLDAKPHKCPCCGYTTSKIHDYRIQKVRDIPYRLKTVNLVYRKRRYVCIECGKRFYEENTFLPRYHQMTSRLSAYIIERLRGTDSFTNIANEVGKSVPTVTRTFDCVSFSTPQLPEVLSIDEFKGNTNKEKYQVILTDPVNQKVLDILPARTSYELTRYFRKYERLDRQNVKYFVSDMYKPYKQLSTVWFTKATIIVDKYHWIRQTMWALDNVRKRVQKKFSKQYRIYFKHSRKLLLEHSSKLDDEQKTQVSIMLSTSPDLSTAYYLKEYLYDVLFAKTKEQTTNMLKEWIEYAKDSKIPEFNPAITAYTNWFSQIVNSCGQTITNGFTEGCNNKIKVLKRNAYGYKRFDRFRKRILFMFSYAA